MACELSSFGPACLVQASIFTCIHTSEGTPAHKLMCSHIPHAHTHLRRRQRRTFEPSGCIWQGASPSCCARAPAASIRRRPRKYGEQISRPHGDIAASTKMCRDALSVQNADKRSSYMALTRSNGRMHRRCSLHPPRFPKMALALEQPFGTCCQTNVHHTYLPTYIHTYIHTYIIIHTQRLRLCTRPGTAPSRQLQATL